MVRPQDHEKYFRVLGIKVVDDHVGRAMPINSSSSNNNNSKSNYNGTIVSAPFGTSCPPDINGDPSKRLLGALRQTQAQVQRTEKSGTNEDLTIKVKRLLNID